MTSSIIPQTQQPPTARQQRAAALAATPGAIAAAGRGRWLVQSQSDANKQHTIWFDSRANAYCCTCEDASHRAAKAGICCKHCLAVKAWVAACQKARQAYAAGTAEALLGQCITVEYQHDWRLVDDFAAHTAALIKLALAATAPKAQEVAA